MELISRRMNLEDLLRRKSFFLFGPRATGKSTLIEQQLPQAKVYDLLDARTLRALVRNPSLIEEQHQDPTQIIAIDEIQKLPSLLDEVHRLITKRAMRFLLTGSSARKLKRGSANLLAGRAWWAELFPLTSAEIPEFNLLTYLNTGGLPQIYGNSDYREELAAYVSLYLKEEVQAEGLTRNLPAFVEFMDVIGVSNGEELNFDSFASDCGVAPGTLKNYLQILLDTYLGFVLPGFTKTKKRKAIRRAKHYLFDVGVVNTLAQRGRIEPRSELFGRAFEHFVITEVRAYLSYARKQIQMYYWRSTSQFEVDLVIGDALAVEIKSTHHVSDKHLRGLRALREEGLIARFVVVSLDPEPRVLADSIEIWPWKSFLEALWQGRLA